MASVGKKRNADKLKLFLCGDVMTGRGIDQILPQPSSPEIYESYLTSAEQYIEIAEQVSGPIPHPVDYDYVWGDALAILQAAVPNMRIVNLETAITTSDENWQHKHINYRMHPGNLPVLSVAEIDCCVLANNHVLDWGYTGLEETLSSLHQAGIKTAGAGLDYRRAVLPAVINAKENHRVIVFSMGSTTSGIGRAWTAGERQPGVWLLDDFSMASVEIIGNRVETVKRHGDIVIASIHWGGNWGYRISEETRQFAHALVDHASVDLVHGHSSHHPRGIEVYKNKLILYGCGDFINDYEGIPGHDKYRDDLRLMYLPELDPANGDLIAMNMPVLQTHRFRLRNASGADARWLAGELDRESRCLSNTRVELGEEGLRLRWG
jgi:poly-gamma-glutamate synthesis protein (capsule biosynthesis protein)